MIVCICNNVNTDTINNSIDAGAQTLDAIREQTGAASCCGKCQFRVNRLLLEREQSITDELTAVPSAHTAYSK